MDQGFLLGPGIFWSDQYIQPCKTGPTNTYLLLTKQKQVSYGQRPSLL